MVIVEQRVGSPERPIDPKDLQQLVISLAELPQFTRAVDDHESELVAVLQGSGSSGLCFAEGEVREQLTGLVQLGALASRNGIVRETLFHLDSDVPLEQARKQLDPMVDRMRQIGARADLLLIIDQLQLVPDYAKRLNTVEAYAAQYAHSPQNIAQMLTQDNAQAFLGDVIELGNGVKRRRDDIVSFLDHYGRAAIRGLSQHECISAAEGLKVRAEGVILSLTAALVEVEGAEKIIHVSAPEPNLNEEGVRCLKIKVERSDFMNRMKRLKAEAGQKVAGTYKNKKAQKPEQEADVEGLSEDEELGMEEMGELQNYVQMLPELDIRLPVITENQKKLLNDILAIAVDCYVHIQLIYPNRKNGSQRYKQAMKQAQMVLEYVHTYVLSWMSAQWPSICAAEVRLEDIIENNLSSGAKGEVLLSISEDDKQYLEGMVWFGEEFRGLNTVLEKYAWFLQSAWSSSGHRSVNITQIVAERRERIARLAERAAGMLVLYELHENGLLEEDGNGLRCSLNQALDGLQEKYELRCLKRDLRHRCSAEPIIYAQGIHGFETISDDTAGLEVADLEFLYSLIIPTNRIETYHEATREFFTKLHLSAWYPVIIEMREQAIKIVAIANKGLLHKYAKQYVGKCTLTEEELVHEAYPAFLDAIRRYIPQNKGGNAFSTYVTRPIIWAMQRVSRQCMTDIRVSDDMGGKVETVRAVVHTLRQELHREPTVGEIAERAGVKVDFVHDVLKGSLSPAAHLSLPVRSRRDGGEELTIGDLLPNGNIGPEDMALLRITTEEVRIIREEFLSWLPEGGFRTRAGYILQWRLLVSEDEQLTQEQCGVLLGSVFGRSPYSKERIRQIEEEVKYLLWEYMSFVVGTRDDGLELSKDHPRWNHLPDILYDNRDNPVARESIHSFILDRLDLLPSVEKREKQKPVYETILLLKYGYLDGAYYTVYQCAEVLSCSVRSILLEQRIMLKDLENYLKGRRLLDPFSLYARTRQSGR